MTKRETIYHFSKKQVFLLNKEFTWADGFKNRRNLIKKFEQLVGLQQLLIRASLGINK